MLMFILLEMQYKFHFNGDVFRDYILSLLQAS